MHKLNGVPLQNGLNATVAHGQTRSFLALVRLGRSGHTQSYSAAVWSEESAKKKRWVVAVGCQGCAAVEREIRFFPTVKRYQSVCSVSVGSGLWKKNHGSWWWWWDREVGAWQERKMKSKARKRNHRHHYKNKKSTGKQTFPSPLVTFCWKTKKKHLLARSERFCRRVFITRRGGWKGGTAVYQEPG